MTTRKTTSKTDPKAAQGKAQAVEDKSEQQAQENLAETTEPSAGDSAPVPEASQGEAAGQDASQGDADKEAPKDTSAEAKDAKDAAKESHAPGEIPALFVRTRKRFGSRRRAGFRFTREGMGLALESLTDEQVVALKKDPALEVEECTVPAEPDEGEE